MKVEAADRGTSVHPHTRGTTWTIVGLGVNMPAKPRGGLWLRTVLHPASRGEIVRRNPRWDPGCESVIEVRPVLDR